jgi:hypothetical protein
VPYKKWSGWRRTSKQRYANPADAKPVLDVSPVARQRVLDAREPLWITEGARKADAAASIGLACVAVLGVRMIPPVHSDEWSYVGLDGRDVYLALDSDATWNPEVRAAEQALVHLLAGKGARVSVVRIPGSPYTKVGLDDFIAAGHGRDDLLKLAVPAADALSAARTAPRLATPTPRAAPTGGWRGCPTFPARYVGRCAVCAAAINVGDSIVWNRRTRAAAHAACATSPKSSSGVDEVALPLVEELNITYVDVQGRPVDSKRRDR